MKKLIAITALIAAVGFNPVQAGPADDTLNIAWGGELATLDRYYNVPREGIIVGRLVWDSLLYKNPETREFEPLLAESWRFLDATTMEFELRRGITFHNGEPFDADDVVFTLNHMSNPDNGVLTQRNVNWIMDVVKVDQYTVQLKIKQPTPTALEFLGGPLLIYPNEYYSAVGSEGMGNKPVGTGPYKVTEFNPGASITFERNESYFADSPKGQPKIGKIVQRTIPDNNTQIAELFAGTVDWIWKVPRDQAERLKTNRNITVANEQTLRIGYSVSAVERARLVQPIFQDPYSSLNPRMTVSGIVGLPLELAGQGNKTERSAKVADMLDMVGLPRRALNLYPGQMSGGQRQRVAIARALVARPRVLICDEPTSALDVSVQSQILNLLQDLRAELNLTYLLISHNLSVVRYMANRLVVMYLGRIVEEAETQRIFDHPAHPYSEALLKAVPSMIPGQGIADSPVQSEFPNPVHPPSGCAFHTRCPYVLERCRSERPPLDNSKNGGRAACHLENV